jgi:hypothetical protein
MELATLNLQTFFLFFIGLICIIFGLIGLIKGKTRSHWWTGLRLLNSDENPGEYWLFIGLLFGISLLCFIASIIFFVFD